MTSSTPSLPARPTRALALGLALVLAAVGAQACSSDETSTATSGGAKDYSDVLALTGNAGNGQIVYGTTCGDANAPCHGPDGDGSQFGAGVLANTVPATDDNTLAGIILDGTGNMGPVNVTKQETADIIAYLRNTFP